MSYTIIYPVITNLDELSTLVIEEDKKEAKVKVALEESVISNPTIEV